MPQSVAIAVVTWNSAAVIERCLHSAEAQSPREIVVVDNGSADDTVARVRRSVPRCEVVTLDENRGFAAACNVAVARSTAPYVLFLNDDAWLEPGYAETLAARLDAEPRVASAVGKLLSPSDNGARRIDSAGIRMAWWALRPDDRGQGEVDRGQYDLPCEVFGPSAARN